MPHFHPIINYLEFLELYKWKSDYKNEECRVIQISQQIDILN